MKCVVKTLTTLRASMAGGLESSAQATDPRRSP